MRHIPNSAQEQPAQLLFDLMVPQFCRPFLGHNDQVYGRQLQAMTAKKFPEQAFHSIPLHRLPQALGHDQTQPGAFGGGRGRQGHAEMARV